MIIALSTVALALLAGSANAAKDDSYYIAGTGNPNVNEKMYWKDAENIFQDLSKFQTLYVEYHNCAWTWSETTDEENDIDENDYWYMGKIPPMGANVAYSLYGSLYGEEFSGCGQDTFINSFYTNTGYGNFATAMYYAGESGFSSYTSGSSTCGGGYGVGCDYDNGFAVHTYNDNECDPQNFNSVKDTLSGLNSALKGAQCVQVYDRSTYGGNPYGTPLEVLAYSHSCFYQDFFSPDGVCPDPYGKLAYYQKQFYKGIQTSKKQDPYQVAKRKVLYQEKIEEGRYMSLAGIILAGLATVMLMVDILSSCCAASTRVNELEKKITAKEKELQSRGDDFILTRRRSYEKDDEETQAEDASDAGYVHMQDDVEAAASTYTPPVDYLDGGSPVANPRPEVPANESPVEQPGPEVQVNVMDQEAPVTLYAPPALLPTEEAAALPLPISFEHDIDVILPPSYLSPETLVPDPDKYEVVADDVEESLTTMETIVADMEGFVTEDPFAKREAEDEAAAVESVPEEKAEEKEEDQPEDAPKEIEEITDAPSTHEPVVETADEDVATGVPFTEVSEEESVPDSSAADVPSTDEPVVETANEDAATGVPSTEVSEKEESVPDSSAEDVTEEEAAPGPIGEEATVEEVAAPEPAEEEISPPPVADEDDVQAEEEPILEIDAVMASREWDTESETEQETTTEKTEVSSDESAPIVAESETEATQEPALQDAIEQSRQREDEIDTHSSLPNLPEDGEGADPDSARSQSWFGF